MLGVSDLRDGTILRSSGGESSYYYQGRRYEGPELAEAQTAGVSENAVDDATWESLPVVPLSVFATSDFVWDTGWGKVDKTEGDPPGHIAHSKGGLFASQNMISGIVEAQSVTLFGGFHILFTILVADARGVELPSAVGIPQIRLGVDGRITGNNYRIQPWSWRLSATDVSLVDQLNVVWHWDPDSLLKILGEWERGLTSLDDCVKKLADIGATIYKAIKGGGS